jgi:methyl-accepting chemotaxis protein
MPNVLVGVEFFNGALPEAALWGRIALGVGIVGLMASLVLVLAHLRDQSSLKHGRDDPQKYRAPKWGPLDRSLGEFFSDPLHSSPLSPDAASEYITGRLDAEQELTQSAIRYFSYAPLLLGLIGTTLALRSLLVTGGNTLQQIQPLLSGVFAGTLGGIAGSLLAAIGGLLLDRVALSASNRAQDFIHRFILPLLPERRIALRIEDAVLAVIGERAQAVAETFKNAIQPIATQMEEVALRCSKAAEAATNAFSEAARALREAGNLEAASRTFKAGAHMIDSSAEQLSDATKQTAEIVLRVGEVRASLGGLLDRVQATADNLASSSERVATQLAAQITDLNARASSVQSCVTDLRSSIEVLAAELVRRANIDSTHLETIKGQGETMGRALTALTQIARESSDTTKMLRASAEAIDKTAEELIQGIKDPINGFTEQVAGTLEKVTLLLERSPPQTTVLSVPNHIQQTDTVPFQSTEIAIIMREAVTEVRRASDESRSLAEAVQRLEKAHSDGADPKRRRFFGRFWG